MLRPSPNHGTQRLPNDDDDDDYDMRLSFTCCLLTGSFLCVFLSQSSHCQEDIIYHCITNPLLCPVSFDVSPIFEIINIVKKNHKVLDTVIHECAETDIIMI